MKQATKVVVLAIIKKDNKFLLTQRAKIDPEDLNDFMGKWEIPGGGMEFGENPEETAIREAQEELGIEVKPKQIIPVIPTKVRHNVWHGVFISILCEMEDTDAAIVLNEECSDYNWFTLEEALQQPLLPVVDTLLKAADTIDLTHYEK